MSVNAVKAAAGAAGEAVKEARTFPAMLTQFKNQIALALPKHLNADRMARIALTAFRNNPALGKCKPESVFAAVIMGSQLGLEPGIMGQAYLIPYGGECNFVPGWQGYVDLVSRAGRASVWTGAVFQGDVFTYGYGDRPFINHTEDPNGSRDPSTLTHVYAVGRVKGAEFPIIEVWSKNRVEQHRNRFNKVGQRHYSFQHFEMYGRKVALLQVIKYMPKSVEMQTLAELDLAAETGAQGLDPKSVIEGSWAPIAPTEPQSDGLDLTVAQASIAAATNSADLTARWAAIVEQAKAAGVEIPVEIDGAYQNRKAALEQKL
jgi:recombination protein RecT